MKNASNKVQGGSEAVKEQQNERGRVSDKVKIAGVLGGMGPEATVDFMAKVIALTDADRDQDHVRMLVDHNPHVPNRQDAILGSGEDPGPVLGEDLVAQTIPNSGKPVRRYDTDGVTVPEVYQDKT